MWRGVLDAGAVQACRIPALLMVHRAVVNYPALIGAGLSGYHGQHLHHRDMMWRSHLHRLKGLFHPHAVDVHRKHYNLGQRQTHNMSIHEICDVFRGSTLTGSAPALSALYAR